MFEIYSFDKKSVNLRRNVQDLYPDPYKFFTGQIQDLDSHQN